MALNWPNRITLLRMLLLAPLAILMVEQARHPEAWKRQAAMAVCAIAATTDGLDGWLARRLQQMTPLGRILDPVADKLFALVTFGLLAAIGVANERDPAAMPMRLPIWVFMTVVGKDVLVTVGYVSMFRGGRRVYPGPRRIGKACTGFQLVTVLLFLIAPGQPVWILQAAGWAASIAGGLAVAAMLDYAVYALRTPRLAAAAQGE